MLGFEEIPGPPPANSIPAAYRLMREVQRDLLGLVQRCFREYGDVFKFEVFGRKQVLAIAPPEVRQVLTDPAYIKGKDYTDRLKGIAKFAGRGLITSNGELWKKQRRLVAPALHATRVASYLETMTSAAERVLGRWRPGELVELDAAMMHTTLEIVGRSLFRADVSEDALRISRAMSALQGMVAANNSVATILPAWFPTPQRLRENRAVRVLDSVVYPLIRGRRSHENADVVDTGDLASTMLLARYEDGGRMSDEQVRDEIVTMFLAGHETTANALNWVFIELARNPAVRTKLEAEVDRVLGAGAPTVEKLDELAYTEAVIKEAMRLHSPIFTFKRECVADTVLGGFRIPKGVDVSLLPYATHLDPRFFPEPERFDPERFLAEKPVDRYAWYPFGGGPRMCAGSGFAMMEMLLVVAWVSRRFRLELPEDQAVIGVPGITLHPKGPLRMRVGARVPRVGG
jgi:cytochrome P450